MERKLFFFFSPLSRNEKGDTQKNNMQTRSVLCVIQHRAVENRPTSQEWSLQTSTTKHADNSCKSFKSLTKLVDVKRRRMTRGFPGKCEREANRDNVWMFFQMLVRRLERRKGDKKKRNIQTPSALCWIEQYTALALLFQAPSGCLSSSPPYAKLQPSFCALLLTRRSPTPTEKMPDLIPRMQRQLSLHERDWMTHNNRPGTPYFRSVLVSQSMAKTTSTSPDTFPLGSFFTTSGREMNNSLPQRVPWTWSILT